MKNLLLLQEVDIATVSAEVYDPFYWQDEESDQLAAAMANQYSLPM